MCIFDLTFNLNIFLLFESTADIYRPASPMLSSNKMVRRMLVYN